MRTHEGRILRQKTLCVGLCLLGLACLVPSANGEEEDAWTARMKEGQQLMAQEKYPEAEQKFRDAQKAATGVDEWKRIVAQARVVNCLSIRHRYVEAEPMMRQCLEYAEKNGRLKEFSLAGWLQVMAQICQELGKYDEADRHFERSLGLFRKVLPPDHPELLTAMHNQAILRKKQGKGEESQAILQQILAVHEKAKEPKTSSLLSILNALSEICTENRQFDDAKRYAERAITLGETSLGADHPAVASSRNTLGLVYGQTDRLDEAVKCFSEARRIYEKALGPENPDVAKALANISKMYVLQARYADAADGLKRAMAIREKAYGANSPQLADDLNSLAALCHHTGNLKEGVEYLRRASEILARVVPPHHPDLVNQQCNLAILLSKQGKDKEALEILGPAIKTVEGAGDNGPRNALLVILLNAQATAQRTLGDTAAAEAALRRAQELADASFSESDPKRTSIRFGLARVLNERGQQDKARPLMEQVLAERLKTLGPDNPFTTSVLSSLAQLTAETGALKESVSFVQRMMRGNLRSLREQQFAMPVSNLENFVRSMRPNEDLFWNICRVAKEVPAEGIEYLILRKGILMETTRARSEAAAADPVVAEKFQSFLRAQAQRANALRRPPPTAGEEQRNALRSNLDREVGQAEETLAKASVSFAQDREIAKTTLPNLLASLPLDACLVEYIAPYTMDFSIRRAHGPRYMALLLAAGQAPQLVDLETVASVDQQIDLYRRLIMAGRVDDPQLAKARLYLYDKLIAPLEPILKKSKTLILAPEGALSLVPFELLAGAKGSPLLDTWNIRYVTSARDVRRWAIFKTQKTASRSEPVILGDPDFDAAAPRNDATDKARGLAGITAETAEGAAGLRFKPLPGARAEAAAISEIWKAEKARCWIGASASKANLLSVKGPRLLHMATHGYFLSDQPSSIQYSGGSASQEYQYSEQDKTRESSFVRSGLALAGANRQAQAKNAASDGLLSAWDVGLLDLQGTELAVLSACETGVGDIQRGEGILGLRQAFLFAGAKAMVVSLWPVPDEETRNLMVKFHTLLRAGTPTAKALQLAKQQLRSELLKTRNQAPPVLWAGFVCIGDPE